MEHKDCANSAAGSYCVQGQCAPAKCSAFGKCELPLVSYICGNYVDGCGSSFHCGGCGGGGMCVDGGRDRACPKDVLDTKAANESAGAASDLGSFTDSPNSGMTSDELSISSSEDVDWLSFKIKDTGFDGNPWVTVTLSWDDPSGGSKDNSEYELAAWFACDSGSPDKTKCVSPLASGETGPGKGCGAVNSYGLGAYGGDALTMSGQIHCSGTLTDSGTVTVRVRKSLRHGRCDRYKVSVQVK